MENPSGSADEFSGNSRIEIQSQDMGLGPQHFQPVKSAALQPALSQESLSAHRSQSIVIPLGGLTTSGQSQITGAINSVCPISITTSTSKSEGLSLEKESSPSTLEVGTTANQPVIHPCILGNIGGANLLSAAFLKKDEGSLPTFASGVSLNGQLIDIVPLIVQDASGGILQAPRVLAPVITDSTKYDSSSSGNTCKNVAQKTVNFNHPEIGFPATASSRDTVADSDSAYKLPLASSDTLIISTASLVRPESDTLSLSSLSHANTDSFITKLLFSEKSATTPTLERPYSLLANISDRSVSLESISSIDLLRADSGKNQNLSITKTDSVLQASATLPQVLSTISLPQDIAVIGDSIPPSLVQLLKPVKNNIPIRDETNSITSLGSQTVQRLPHETEIVKKCMENLTEETSNDTDTDMQSEDEENQEEKSLSRSDTVILNASDTCERVASPAKVTASDTVLLSEDDKVAQKSERLSRSSGIRSNPLSTVISSAVGESAVDKVMASSKQTLILTNEPPSGYSSLGTITGQQNKTLYMVTADGHLTILGYVPANNTELLSRPASMTSVLPQVQPQFTTVSQIQEATTRTVDVKETQTELVFGTNTVFFRPVDSTSQCNVYTVDQPPNIGIIEPLNIQPSTIPATVVFSQNSGQLHQPHPSEENFQRTGVSLAVPPTMESATGSDLQAVPQECGVVPPQTSESQLPGASSIIMMSPESSTGENSAMFSCMKCQEKFKTKQELISHEKNHKRGYKCDLCNATFTRMGNYNRHRKIHNLQHEDQITFKCNDCGREFLQRCDLKRHLLIHTKQEPHRCEKCGKGYIRHSDLVVHMRFHNKEKAFSCSLCDKKFFQSGDLNRHVRRAHKPNTQLTCGHCDRKYACETTLIRHMKAVHKDIILHTVNQRLQESDSGNKDPVVNTKDVLFTMVQKGTDS